MGLKWFRGAVMSTPEPVTHRKRGVPTDVLPPKQRWKIIEGKAFIGVDVTD